MIRAIEQSRLTEVIEQMCDSYCKYPFNTETQADLNEICEKCPLNTILFEKEGGSDDE